MTDLLTRSWESSPRFSGTRIEVRRLRPNDPSPTVTYPLPGGPCPPLGSTQESRHAHHPNVPPARHRGRHLRRCLRSSRAILPLDLPWLAASGVRPDDLSLRASARPVRGDGAISVDRCPDLVMGRRGLDAVEQQRAQRSLRRQPRIRLRPRPPGSLRWCCRLYRKSEPL